jgi:hypothetical protein
MSGKKKLGWTRADRLKIRVKRMLGMNIVICDSCKWDYRTACRHPERPNAIWCPDYEKKSK